MTEVKLYEAVWTLNEGHLDTEQGVSDLFIAIGEVVAIEPARYEMNRRGKWRSYSGPRLMVDVLTQRTQLVTIASSESIEEGGTEVVLATGKQGKPPQAVARWWQPWPPTSEQIEEWRIAIGNAFATLPLATFALRTEGTSRIKAVSADRDQWNEYWNKE